MATCAYRRDCGITYFFSSIPGICMTERYIPNNPQLLSVISLLSQSKPDLDSPANVDAAKEVRDDFSSECHLLWISNYSSLSIWSTVIS